MGPAQEKMRMKIRIGILIVAAALILSGCSSHKSSKLDPFAGVGSPYYAKSGPLPKGGGRYHVGKPYQVAGRWFTPKEQPRYDKTGLASWYGEAFHRRKTSNGEWFNMNDLTAAHATLPLPSYAKVTNLENGRSVIVRINDRGPFVDTRIIDLSKASATALGYKEQGTAQVRVQWIGVAPLNDSGQNLLAMNNALGQGAAMSQLRQVASSASTSPGLQVAALKSEKPAIPATLATSSGAPMTSKATSAFIVQVASFTDQSNAISAKAMLDGVTDVRVAEAQTNAGYVYRLQTRPIGNEAEAMRVLTEIQSIGFFDAKLVVTRIQQVATLQ
jgi:rare lipoprotein A